MSIIKDVKISKTTNVSLNVANKCSQQSGFSHRLGNKVQRQPFLLSECHLPFIWGETEMSCMSDGPPALLPPGGTCTSTCKTHTTHPASGNDRSCRTSPPSFPPKRQHNKQSTPADRLCVPPSYVPEQLLEGQNFGVSLSLICV